MGEGERGYSPENDFSEERTSIGTEIKRRPEREQALTEEQRDAVDTAKRDIEDVLRKEQPLEFDEGEDVEGILGALRRETEMLDDPQKDEQVWRDAFTERYKVEKDDDAYFVTLRVNQDNHVAIDKVERA